FPETFLKLQTTYCIGDTAIPYDLRYDVQRIIDEAESTNDAAHLMLGTPLVIHEGYEDFVPSEQELLFGISSSDFNFRLGDIFYYAAINREDLAQKRFDATEFIALPG